MVPVSAVDAKAKFPASKRDVGSLGKVGIGTANRVMGFHMGSREAHIALIRGSRGPATMMAVNSCLGAELMDYLVPVALVVGGIALLGLAYLVSMNESDGDS